MDDQSTYTEHRERSTNVVAEPDYLAEAYRIARGESKLLVQRAHLEAVIAYAARLEKQLEAKHVWPAYSGAFAQCGLCGTRTSKANRCTTCATVVCFRCQLTETCNGELHRQEHTITPLQVMYLMEQQSHVD